MMTENAGSKPKTDAHGKRSSLPRATLCLAVSCLMAFPPPAPAEPDSSEAGRLTHYEQTVFGKTSSAETAEDRVAALETNLLGKRQSGDITGRLDAVGKLLGVQGAPPSEVPKEVERKQGYVDMAVANQGDLNDLLRKGLQQYAAGNLVDAERTFQEVLARDSQNTHALFNLGAIDERRGNLESSLQRYQAALSLSPNDRELQATVDSVRNEVCRRQELGARAEADRAYQATIEQARNRQEARVGTRPPPTVEVRNPGRSRAATAARTAAMLGIVVGIGALSGRGGLGGLHCPMCRILGGF